MGYQALLFCPDEKLARVVTQVFSDLDFTVEPVNEPFSAVKKLMALRYDALVVDCENEQNASLLFKSARNSSSNQSSLALALVEGQAGVAKAYRIGANLVLTKPINVEQAKGTLRVARGLLRKNLDAAPAAAPAAAKPAPAPAADLHQSAHHEAAPIPSAHNIYEAPEFLQETAASAAVETHGAIPALDAQAKLVAELSAPEPEVPAPAPEKPAIAPVSSHPGTSGTAAAPAPAKEAAAAAVVEKRSMAPEFVGHAQVSSAPSTPIQLDAPTFAALRRDDDSQGSGGSKKILMVAAGVLVVAALAYFGWTKFGQKSTGAQPVSSPLTQAVTPSPAATAPPAVSAPEPSQSSTPSTTASQFSKPSAAANPSLAIKNDVEEEPVVKKSAAPAIIVKSATPSKRVSAPAEESAPQVPNPFAVAPANDKHLSTLVASAPVNLPKAVPSTLRISQGVSQGLLIKRVQPRYPQNALSMRIQGVVQLEATIDKEGNVKNLKVVSGDAILARAATDAVRQWRYKPYYLDGDPVEIQTQISVNFKLPN